MREKKNKFQKSYLMFFICIFIFGNVAPGINSYVIAITEDISNQSTSEIQTELNSDVTLPADIEDITETYPHEVSNASYEETKQVEEINKENLPDFPLNKTEDELYKKSNSSQRYIARGVYGNVNWQINDAGILNIGTGGGTFPSTTEQSPPWRGFASKIKGINFDGGTNGIVYTGASAQGLFQGLNKVEWIVNLQNLKISNSTTDMSYMFADMSSLTSFGSPVPFSSIGVTKLTGMFRNLSSLHTLELSMDYRTTDNVTDMSYMFSGVSSLTSLDLGVFDTRNVTDMSYMFSGMSSLTSLNVGHYFKADNVTNTSNMFSGMSSLTSLSLPNFGTNQIKDMYRMFFNMSSLTSLSLSPNFRTSKVQTMRETFHGVSSLTSLNLKGWDTSNVTDMCYMFLDMSSLTSLDLGSSFDTSNVKNMFGMFRGMSSLTSLDLGKFDTSQVTTMDYMFTHTSNLKYLILGENFKFIVSTVNAGLVGPSKTSEYTGKWFNANTKQNVWTSKELMSKYNGETDAGTYTWQTKELEVIAEDVEYSLGTPVANLDTLLPIIRVEQGGAFVDEKYYKVSMRNQIDTSKLGEQELQLRVMLKADSTIYKDITVKANIIWGSTLVVEDDGQKAVDASVSLIDNNGLPSLNANQGFGTLNPLLSTRPDFKVFRGATTQKVLDTGVGVITESPQELSKRWNDSFASTSLKYGDVAVITVRDWWGTENWHGEDTFISRNEELVKETEGYDEAYYELTKEGYRLLHLNQFTVNNGNHVSLETTKEVMNKNITDYITLPTTLENPEDYRMEFASVDTTSSGKKTSTLNIYEKLESGGEFLTTYEVNYVVDPVVTEHYYNTDNNLLSSDKTEFEYGTSFEPAPVMHREDNGILYIYKGWSDEKPGTENAQVVEGVPSPTTEEKTYYYIYEKADKFINVTLPTEVIFGTNEDPKTITSKDYTIKNNSNLVDLEVDLASFDKVKSDVKLLDKEAPAPTEKEASARLDLMMNNKSVITGLTETTAEQELGYITRGQSSSLGLSGTYFGDKTDNHKVEYAMYLKFKARVDEEK